MKPNPAYFTDPKQNVIKDFFKFATQSGTSGGSVSGAEHTALPPAAHEVMQSQARPRQ